MLEAETGRRVSAPPPTVWCNGDTPRIRPFPGYRHDCPRPGRGGGGGQRPGGVGDVSILKVETGEGAFCPRPICPTPGAMSPRVYIPHGCISPTVQCPGIHPGYGLSPGIATTAPAPRGRGGGCWHIDRRERPRKARLPPSFRVIVGVSTLIRQNL